MSWDSSVRFGAFQLMRMALRVFQLHIITLQDVEGQRRLWDWLSNMIYK